MQLKHQGKHVAITLNVTEQRTLDKAVDLLGMVAILPCQQSQAARETAEAIVKLRAGMTKMVEPSE